MLRSGSCRDFKDRSCEAKELSREELQREVERELTGEYSEAYEFVYFKLYKSQIPIVEKAIETAALMLGSDKSRGYCLEMICADFLAGATLDGSDPDLLLKTQLYYFKFLNPDQQARFMAELGNVVA